MTYKAGLRRLTSSIPHLPHCVLPTLASSLPQTLQAPSHFPPQGPGSCRSLCLRHVLPNLYAYFGLKASAAGWPPQTGLSWPSFPSLSVAAPWLTSSLSPLTVGEDLLLVVSLFFFSVKTSVRFVDTVVLNCERSTLVIPFKNCLYSLSLPHSDFPRSLPLQSLILRISSG